MDTDQFDTLVTRLSDQLTRRRHVQLLGAVGAAAAGLAAGTDAKKRKKKHKKKPAPPSATTQAPPATSTTLAPAPSGIVISQLYTRGGNIDAVYTQDYIELFNRSSQPVDVGTWSVQVSNASTTNWAVVSLTGKTMLAGQYLLVAGASGGSAGVPLPGYDVSSSVSVLSGGGQIALVASVTPLTCDAATSCAAASGVVDFLGYGTLGAHSEGGRPAAAPSSSEALYRKAGGCTDTNVNSADFELKPPSPRVSGFPQQCP